MKSLKRLLPWAQRNERRLGAVLFVFGFITDLFTFALLPVTFVSFAFLFYLLVAGTCTLGSHLFSASREHTTTWRRVLSVVFPLGAQYAIGSLLSGFLIYYTKSAAVLVSWPFLALLVLVFLGNEYFRTYYKYLAFQAVLLFFSLYAYLIFELPILVHRLGPWIFLASTVLSVVIFIGFLAILSRLHRTGFAQSRKYVAVGTAGVLIVLNVSYFTGIIPPIPLALTSTGVYHDLRHANGNYVVSTEQDVSWWNFGKNVIHHVPGTPVYVFSSISAPIQFSAGVVHVWEYYDAKKEKWKETGRVHFTISGGRDGGYRGYSQVNDIAPGKWRVTIETQEGQVIGRINFTVLTVNTQPLTKEEAK